MHWYLIYTKPYQEHDALQNLQRQGYLCYLPQVVVAKAPESRVPLEPLFPRYLFIRLNHDGHARDFAPIRSILSVSSVVCVRQTPIKVNPEFIAALQTREASRPHTKPPTLGAPLEKPVPPRYFSGIERLDEMLHAVERVRFLMESLTARPPAPLLVSLGGLQKVS